MDFYKEMDDEDTINVLGVFALCLMAFATLGSLWNIVPYWAAVWLIIAGVVVEVVALAIIFVKNDFFLHDITKDN